MDSASCKREQFSVSPAGEDSNRGWTMSYLPFHVFATGFCLFQVFCVLSLHLLFCDLHFSTQPLVPVPVDGICPTRQDHMSMTTMNADAWTTVWSHSPSMSSSYDSFSREAATMRVWRRSISVCSCFLFRTANLLCRTIKNQLPASYTTDKRSWPGSPYIPSPGAVSRQFHVREAHWPGWKWNARRPNRLRFPPAGRKQWNEGHGIRRQGNNREDRPCSPACLRLVCNHCVPSQASHISVSEFPTQSGNNKQEYVDQHWLDRFQISRDKEWAEKVQAEPKWKITPCQISLQITGQVSDMKEQTSQSARPYSYIWLWIIKVHNS